MALLDLLDHPVKESRKRVSISSETRPVYVQSIYDPGLWVWDWGHVEREFVVQMSGKQVHMRSEPLLADLFDFFVYLGFYVAFNTVQVISRRVVGRAEETST